MKSRTHLELSSWLGTLKHLLVLLLAVFVAVKIVPGVEAESWGDLLCACLVLAILNTFLKPLLFLISLPLIVLSLGLFFFVLNAALLSLTSWIVPGFQVSGFWPALGGALVITLVNLFFGIRSRVVVKNQSPRPSHPYLRRRPDDDDDVIDI